MLGEQIKKIRIANKMSQVEVARLLDVSKQSVSNWENNNVVPSVKMIKSICQLFCCSADYLYELDVKERIILDGTALTKEQLVHINQLIQDYTTLNKKLAELQDAKTT